MTPRSMPTVWRALLISGVRRMMARQGRRENPISHPIAVANILADMRLDEEGIITTLFTTLSKIAM